MKLPRSLRSLTGPSTPELQKSFLRDLKLAFRDRVDHQASPAKSTINTHFQSILTPSSAATTKKQRVCIQGLNPVDAARQCYLEGRLTPDLLHDMIARTTSKIELDSVAKYSLRSGIDLVNQSTSLSARFAAKLLHLGHTKEVKSMIARHTKHWIATQSAHPVLVLYASKTEGIDKALEVFNHLIQHDSKNLTTPLTRTLLRESVRHSNLRIALHCIGLDMRAAAGQETGLAKWLLQRDEASMAFKVLLHAEPALTREANVGLDIAWKMVKHKQFGAARRVCTWVENRYSLSVQDELRKLKTELEAENRTGEREAVGIPSVLVGQGS